MFSSKLRLQLEPKEGMCAQVFQDPARRRSLYLMLAAVAALFALYLLAVRYWRSRGSAQTDQA